MVEKYQIGDVDEECHKSQVPTDFGAHLVAQRSAVVTAHDGVHGPFGEAD